MYKKDFPRWKDLAVKHVADIYPYCGKHDLYQHRGNNRLRICQPVPHQGNLQIGNHINTEQRKEL